jgi:hypothetical protein
VYVCIPKLELGNEAICGDGENGCMYAFPSWSLGTRERGKKQLVEITELGFLQKKEYLFRFFIAIYLLAM